MTRTPKPFARTVEQAVALFELHKPDLAVLDVRLANGGIVATADVPIKGKGEYARPRIVVLSGPSDFHQPSESGRCFHERLVIG